MAFKYKQYSIEGTKKGYIEFNISPDFNSVNGVIGVGDTITISGRASSSLMRIRSIECFVSTVIQEGESWYNASLGYVNKGISKGNTGSFSIKCTVTQIMLDMIFAALGPDNTQTETDGLISFYIYDEYDMDGDADYTRQVSSHKYSFIKRYSPAITTITPSDTRRLSSISSTSLAYFGGYVQDQSKPRFSIDFSIDSRDTKLTATHELVIKDEEDYTVASVSGTTAYNDTHINLDFQPLTVYGDLTYEYILTDSSGVSVSRTGSITVFEYSPPEIDIFELQRYKHIIDEGDVPADDGTKIWTTLVGEVTSINSLNAWHIDINYGEAESSIRNTVSDVISDTDGREYIATKDPRLFPIEIPSGSTYELTAVLTDMLGSIAVSKIVLKAGGFMNIEKTGVAVGQRSTSDANNKKFEVNEEYISYFYGGIYGVNNYSVEEINTYGHWIDGKEIYRSMFTGQISGVGAFKLGEIKNYDKVINITGTYYRDTDSMYRTLPFMSYAGTGWSASVVVQNNGIQNIGDVNLYLGTSNTGKKDYYVIVYYTKNDDENN